MRLLQIALLFGLVTLGSGLIPAEAAEGKKKAKDPEQVFKKRDQDGDAFLSLAEFQGKKPKPDAEARFKKRDKDGDGKISLAEFKARGKKKAAGL